MARGELGWGAYGAPVARPSQPFADVRHHGIIYHYGRELLELREFENPFPQSQVQASLNAAVALSTAPLLQQVGQIARRVAVLEQRQSVAAVTLPIFEFPGYRLTAPLSVRLEEIEGGWIATLPELDLWADGISEGDAVEELKASVASLANDLLGADDSTLGPRPRRWRALLTRLAERQ